MSEDLIRQMIAKSVEELKALNEKFFELAARVDKYSEKLSDEQYKFMQDKLLEQYTLQYRLFALQSGIDTERKIYELESKSAQMIPRWRRTLRSFFRLKPNYAASLIDSEVTIEAQYYFRKCEQELLKHYAPVEESAEQSEDLAEKEEETAGEDGSGDGKGEGEERADVQNAVRQDGITGEAEEHRSEERGKDRTQERDGS